MKKLVMLKEFTVKLDAALVARGLKPVKVRAIDTSERGLVHFLVEAWSTWKLTMRAKDGAIVNEGRDLAGPGTSQETISDRIVAEVQAWTDFCKLHDSIDNKTQFILGHTTVVTHDGNKGLGVYRVEFNKPCSDKPFNFRAAHPTYSDVVESSPRDAAAYAWRYVGDEAHPVKVTYLGEWKDLEHNYGKRSESA